MNQGLNNDELLRLLEMTNQEIRRYHDAVWTEEKHYTWLSYILTGGLVFLLVNIDRTNSPTKAVGLFLAGFITSLVGMLLCYFGFRAVRRESSNLFCALQTSNRLRRLLKLNDLTISDSGTTRQVYRDEETTIGEWENVKEKAYPPFRKLINPFSLCKLDRTTYLFQVTILLPFAFFAVGILYSVVAFILYCVGGLS